MLWKLCKTRFSLFPQGFFKASRLNIRIGFSGIECGQFSVKINLQSIFEMFCRFLNETSQSISILHRLFHLQKVVNCRILDFLGHFSTTYTKNYSTIVFSCLTKLFLTFKSCEKT